MRTCIDCSADISHRGAKAKRCEACSKEALRQQRAEASRRYRSRHKSTPPVHQTAVVPAKASINYAQVMHRWEERTSGPTRASVILDPKGQPYNVQERAQTNRPGGGFFGGLTHGGIQNFNSGLGTGADKTEATFFSPTRFYPWRSPLGNPLCPELGGAEVHQHTRGRYVHPLAHLDGWGRHGRLCREDG